MPLIIVARVVVRTSPFDEPNDPRVDSVGIRFEQKTAVLPLGLRDHLAQRPRAREPLRDLGARHDVVQPGQNHHVVHAEGPALHASCGKSSRFISCCVLGSPLTKTTSF